MILKPNYRMKMRHAFEMKVDFDTFLDFKRQCLDRDSNASEVISDIIIKTQKDGSFLALDIGTGEGMLIKEVLKKCPSIPIRFDLVEPTIKGVRLIERNLREYVKNGSVHIYRSPFERFPESEHEERYHLVLCSHTFYHFQQKDWTRLMAKILRLLADGGFFINILVSKETFLYEMARLFRGSLKQKEELTEEFGYFVFSEDFENLLYKEKIDFMKKQVFSRLDYSDSYPNYLKGLADVELSRLVKNLCYLFRVDVKKLTRVQLTDIKRETIKSFNNMLAIKSDVFIVKKTISSSKGG